MDETELTHADAVRLRFRRALLASMAFVAALGAVFFAGPWLGDTGAFALVPQSWPGLVGVITAPLLHGSAGHWLANASALLILGPLVGTVYPRAALRALPLIWVLSGLVTWSIGRPSPHIGASGLTHGLLFLLLFLGLLRRDRAAIAAALIGFFFYGGMLLTVLPREAGISWEYHLGGEHAGRTRCGARALAAAGRPERRGAAVPATPAPGTAAAPGMSAGPLAQASGR